MTDGLNSDIARRQFDDALRNCHPRAWQGGALSTLSFEALLNVAESAGDDGGSVSISRPRISDRGRKGSPSVAVFDGEPDLQRMLQVSLADYLALIEGRSGTSTETGGTAEDGGSDSASRKQALLQRGEGALAEAAVAAEGADVAVPATRTCTRKAECGGGACGGGSDLGALYGCQIPLAGSGAPTPDERSSGALRQAMAAGVLAILPSWATAAVAAAEAAILATAACRNDAETSSVNAWLCAPPPSGSHNEDGSGTADDDTMRTECHYDG